MPPFPVFPPAPTSSGTAMASAASPRKALHPGKRDESFRVQPGTIVDLHVLLASPSWSVSLPYKARSSKAASERSERRRAKFVPLPLNQKMRRALRQMLSAAAHLRIPVLIQRVD